MKRDLIQFQPKSLYFPSPNLYSHNRDRMFYAHMFLEDLGNSIMPIGGSRYSGKPFSITISPIEQQNKMKINLLFPSEFHSIDQFYSPLEETVASFIEDCVNNLIIRGTQYYEIVPASINPKIDKESQNLSGPVFVMINISGRVLKLGDVYIQFIPKNLWKKANKRLIILPASSVWQVSIPRKIGGMRAIKEILKGLFVAGEKNRVELKILEDGVLKKGFFDINSYYRNAELYVAWLTRSWGWDIRSSLQRYSLEYYQIHRRIMSAYTLAIFREHIFEAMNSLLSRIGYEFKLEMIGLPTSVYLYSMFSELENKKISFQEAYDLTNIQ